MPELINRRGNFVWSSDLIDAGPYNLGWTRMYPYVAVFGNRTAGITRPGSNAQRWCFHQSKAAFLCCEFIHEETEPFGLKVHPDEGIAIIDQAKRSARKLWSQMGHQVYYDSSEAEGYYYETLRDFKAARLTEAGR